MNQPTDFDTFLNENPDLKHQVELFESLFSAARFCFKIPAELLSMPLPFLAHRDYQLVKTNLDYQRVKTK